MFSFGWNNIWIADGILSNSGFTLVGKAGPWGVTLSGIVGPGITPSVRLKMNTSGSSVMVSSSFSYNVIVFHPFICFIG